VPPNSSRDPKVGLRVKHGKKKRIGARSLIHSTLGVGGLLELYDGTRMNPQVEVQDEVNLHNQEKRVVNAS
jgi:hypothetical protein